MSSIKEIEWDQLKQGFKSVGLLLSLVISIILIAIGNQISIGLFVLHFVTTISFFIYGYLKSKEEKTSFETFWEIDGETKELSLFKYLLCYMIPLYTMIRYWINDYDLEEKSEMEKKDSYFRKLGIAIWISILFILFFVKIELAFVHLIFNNTLYVYLTEKFDNYLEEDSNSFKDTLKIEDSFIFAVIYAFPLILLAREMFNSVQLKSVGFKITLNFLLASFISMIFIDENNFYFNAYFLGMLVIFLYFLIYFYNIYNDKYLEKYLKSELSSKDLKKDYKNRFTNNEIISKAKFSDINMHLGISLIFMFGTWTTILLIYALGILTYNIDINYHRMFSELNYIPISILLSAVIVEIFLLVYTKEVNNDSIFKIKDTNFDFLVSSRFPGAILSIVIATLLLQISFYGLGLILCIIHIASLAIFYINSPFYNSMYKNFNEFDKAWKIENILKKVFAYAMPLLAIIFSLKTKKQKA